MNNRVLYAISQAMPNVLFGAIIIYLSHLGLPELVVKYSTLFMMVSFIQPIVALRFEQQIYRIDVRNVADIYSTVLFCSLITLVVAFFVIDRSWFSQFSRYEVHLSIFVSWLFGVSSILRQIHYRADGGKNISLINIVSMLFVLVCWLKIGSATMYSFLLPSVLVISVFLVVQVYFIPSAYKVSSFAGVVGVFKQGWIDASKLCVSLVAAVAAANALVFVFTNHPDQVYASKMLVLIRLLLLPVSLLAIPVSQLIAKDLACAGERVKTLRRYMVFVFISLFLYNLFLLFSPEKFWDVLGVDGLEVGLVTIVISLAMFLRGAVSPFTVVYNVVGENTRFLVFQLFQLVFIFCVYVYSLSEAKLEYVVYLYGFLVVFFSLALVCDVLIAVRRSEK